MINSRGVMREYLDNFKNFLIIMTNFNETEASKNIAELNQSIDNSLKNLSNLLIDEVEGSEQINKMFRKDLNKMFNKLMKVKMLLKLYGY